tara:strand:- start:228 stop:1163 length:936 start_codon:yes stop_codon:yes gene_type:complete
MVVVKQLENLKKINNSVLAVGSFDGLHLGHKKIISSLIKLSKINKIPSVIITFNPNPYYVIEKSPKNNCIMSLDEKLEIFNDLGIDYVFILDFNNDIAKITADKFLKIFIVEKFNPAYIVVGHDNCFGNNREGDKNFLNKRKYLYNYTIKSVNPRKIDDVIISSSIIRKKIKSGDMDGVSKYLGRMYKIKGLVVKGDGRGSKDLLPTANLKLIFSKQIIPCAGVYCVEAVIDKINYIGICNVGKRPTFYQNGDLTIEVHLISREYLNIYGKVVDLKFKKFIRYEQSFNNKFDLLEQLKIDKESCREQSIIN